MHEWITNTLGIPVMPPKGEFISFQTDEEKQLFVEKYDIAKYRTKNKEMYGYIKEEAVLQKVSLVSLLDTKRTGNMNN